jgi:lysozyme
LERAAPSAAVAAAALVLGVVAAAGDAAADEAWTERCATRATVRGIDVSKWQGTVDWQAVRDAGIQFAYIRVSDGLELPDPMFASNWEGARAAGVTRGAYQFLRPEEDPEAQADLLLEAAGAPRRGDLPPAVDVEVAGGVDPPEVVRRIDRWVRRVKRAIGIDPIVYTSALNWLELTENSARFRGLALWVAHHDVDCPNTPAPWPRWTFHQRSTAAAVAGIVGPVDENAFLGSHAALRRRTTRDPEAALRAWKRWRRAYLRSQASVFP